MARAIPTPVTASYAGTVVPLTAPPADGDVIPTNAQVLVAAGATPTTVTIVSTGTVGGLDVEDAGGTVAANTTRLFGPFPARLFAQPSDASVGASRVLVDYSSVATVTRAVLG